MSLDAGLGSGISRFTGQGGFGTGDPTNRTLYLLGDRSSADNTLVGGNAGDLLRGGGDDVMRGANVVDGGPGFDRGPDRPGTRPRPARGGHTPRVLTRSSA